jgi:uncharacterized membrane protein
MGETSPTKETTRLEAFSDGVFAIAITLLVLEIRLPQGGHLARALYNLWPSYLSFAISFVTILIMWTNHHANLAHVVKADARLMFTNGFLLLFVTFLPFPTAVLAEHLTGDEARVAAAFYAGTFVCINLAWFAFWRAITANRASLAPDLPDHEVTIVNGALAVGLASYAVATALGWFWPPGGIGLVILLAAFWTYQAMRHRHEEGHDAAAEGKA